MKIGSSSLDTTSTSVRPWQTARRSSENTPRTSGSTRAFLVRVGLSPFPPFPWSRANAVMEEAVGPVKSTLQLTQDSLSITRDTLAITRDSLEKTRDDLLMREKDNAALAADLENARKELMVLEAKVIELENKYKDQSLDLSQTKADLAVSEKEAFRP